MALFYVLFGHPQRRAWADARRYGFVSGGGGRRWSNPLLRLSAGDEVLVHVPQAGYVGHGRVRGPRVAASDLVVDVGGARVPLLDAPLESPGLGLDADDEALREYVVSVDWLKTVGLRQAYWRPGLFHRRTTVTPFTDTAAAKEITSGL